MVIVMTLPITLAATLMVEIVVGPVLTLSNVQIVNAKVKYLVMEYIMLLLVMVCAMMKLTIQIATMMDLSVVAQKLLLWSIMDHIILNIPVKNVYVKVSKYIFQDMLLHGVVYDQNHYFGSGLIPKLKPRLADTFGPYRNRYRDYILKGEYSYRCMKYFVSS